MEEHRSKNESAIAAARARSAERERLLTLRRNVDQDIRARVAEHAGLVVDAIVAARERAGLTPPRIAFYWPIRAEPSLIELMKATHARGVTTLLPVVVSKGAALVFRAFAPGVPMQAGAWKIPEPAIGPDVAPDVLFAPLVGFDDRGYRLGNGGGFYDRTLAALRPRPRAIGIGFECLRMDSIEPQPHDEAMDLIVTEQRLTLEQVATWW